jgi:hypothetical protein
MLTRIASIAKLIRSNSRLALTPNLVTSLTRSMACSRAGVIDVRASSRPFHRSRTALSIQDLLSRPRNCAPAHSAAAQCSMVPRSRHSPRYPPSLLRSTQFTQHFVARHRQLLSPQASPPWVVTPITKADVRYRRCPRSSLAVQ